MIQKTKRLGDMLVEANLLSEEQLKEALVEQKKTNKKLGAILIDSGFIDEHRMVEVLEAQLGIPHVDLTKYHIDAEIPVLISERLASRHHAIPIAINKEKLVVAMSDPLDIFALDDVKLATGYEIEPVIATYGDIEASISRHYTQTSSLQALEDFKENYEFENMDVIDEDLMAQINNAPVVKLINNIIEQAVKLRASDIHIEPYEKEVRVSLRIDGELYENITPSKSSHSAIVTRIKIISNMNIAERRVPQDGRVEMFVNDRDIDMRISVLPTVFGEKVVIRLLDRSAEVMTKEQLGFTSDNLKQFEKIVDHPYGIVLVTGPTGSGKTTTLYTVLSELNVVSKNIVTVEDPVEYRLDGINQSQVNIKAGMTFANGLRSILRQDPDIVMIGEIRDMETAQIAVRAAITGHLVLSTVHTNDTASTVARMVDMGVEPFLLSSSLVGIIAQRLVKKVCSHCKEEYEPNERERNLLKLEPGQKLYHGTGCNFCNESGYRGRTAIHEVMPIDSDIRNLIDQLARTDELRNMAMSKGMTTLRQSCAKLVKRGITTVDEMLRITIRND